MHTVFSRDGTPIAYEQFGKGPALILVGGLFEHRAIDSETAQLAAFPLLREHCTVIHYDRRGRGASGDTPPYAVAREIEDIDALLAVVGGAAALFGISSGAALVFEAALALGPRVTKLAMYEPPYNDDPAARQAWQAYRRDLDQLVAVGQPDALVERAMQLFGVPPDAMAAMRESPMWPPWAAMAPTIVYDAAVLGTEAAVPLAWAAGLRVPTLVLVGDASYPFMQVTATALVQAIPQAQLRVLAGQTHEVTAAALAPVLVDWLTAPQA
jgi:pimeloyl-ACP methyl ester carboxylesterase